MVDLLLVLLLGQAPASSCGVADEPEFAITKERPVQVGGGAFTIAARERRYLDALRGPEGQPVQYKRVGTERGADQTTILDRYEVTYPGLEKPLYLFLDAYHFDDALKAPKGLTCAVPIGLAPPPPDGFLAMDAAYRLAVERANRDIAPISLDTDGSSTHGIIVDRFRRQSRMAKAALASGTPIDPKQRPQAATIGMVVVAFPLRCGDKPPVSPAAIDVVPAQGAPVRVVGELATGEAVARLLPEAALPAGSVAAEFPLERPRPSDTIRIGYPESACGPANEASLPMKYTNGRPVNTPAPILPDGQASADRPVLLQVLIDVDGSVQEPSYVGGPMPLVPAAIEAVRGWTTEPAKLNGAPIVTPVMMHVRFKPR
jgi:hypothetical protein